MKKYFFTLFFFVFLFILGKKLLICIFRIKIGYYCLIKEIVNFKIGFKCSYSILYFYLY